MLIRIIHLLFFFCIISANSFSQNFWNYQGLSGSYIGFITGNNDKMWASQYLGDSIYFSNNNGTDWSGLGKISEVSSNLFVTSILHFQDSLLFTSTISIGINSDGIYKSTNGGINWYYSGNGIINKKVWEICSDVNGNLFAGTIDGIYKSTNDGTDWIKLNNSPDSINVENIVIVSDSEIIVAGSNDVLFKSTNYGQTWNNINNGINHSSFSSLILTAGSYLFLGTDGGIYKSSDYGENWNLVMPSYEIRNLTSNKTGMILAGTEIGPFISSNSGADWELVTSGLPNNSIFSVHLNYDGYAFCSVTDFGIFKSSSQIVNVDENYEYVNDYELLQNYPNPFNPITKIKFTISKSAPTKLLVYDFIGKQVKSLMDDYKEAGTYEVTFNASEFASGVYFYTLQSAEYIITKKMTLLK